MSSSSKRSSSSLSFLAAAVRRPSNFGFQWSMVEQGVLERRLRLLLDGSLAWRFAFWCLLSASGLDVDIVFVSGLWMLVWSGAIAEKILKFRCLSTSFSTAVMLGNFSISTHKLMVAVHSSLTREKKTRSVENNLRTTSLIDNSVTGTVFSRTFPLFIGVRASLINCNILLSISFHFQAFGWQENRNSLVTTCRKYG